MASLSRNCFELNSIKSAIDTYGPLAPPGVCSGSHGRKRGTRCVAVHVLPINYPAPELSVSGQYSWIFISDQLVNSVVTIGTMRVRQLQFLISVGLYTLSEPVPQLWIKYIRGPPQFLGGFEPRLTIVTQVHWHRIGGINRTMTLTHVLWCR